MKPDWRAVLNHSDVTGGLIQTWDASHLPVHTHLLDTWASLACGYDQGRVVDVVQLSSADSGRRPLPYWIESEPVSNAFVNAGVLSAGVDEDRAANTWRRSSASGVQS